MDLIYTDSKGIDIGVLSAYAFDMSFGASENDFELILASSDVSLEDGAFIYIENTEYGGINDGIKATTDGDTVTYKGRTWHGILNSKVISPNSGEDYYKVSGEANEVLRSLISRLGLEELFAVGETDSGINIKKYQFVRYCKGYDGIRDMLASFGAKLHIEWNNRKVNLSALPVSDYTNTPIDTDSATLSVEKYSKKVNHLICLGKGESAQREVIHLYADTFGKIGYTQCFTGIDEYVDTYEYTSAESSDELLQYGIKRLKELRDSDKADILLKENANTIYDIGDTVGAVEYRTGIEAAATVTQKIIKINNGAVSIEYKTGE